MKEDTEHLTSSISFKTTASQKAEYDKIAHTNDLSRGEWVRAILEMNKYSYRKIGEPTEKEIELLQITEDLKAEVIKTKMLKEFAVKSFNVSEEEKEEIRNALLELKANNTHLMMEIGVSNQNVEQTNTEKEQAELRLSKIISGLNILIQNGNSWNFAEIETLSNLKTLSEL